jgi:hypothetical protein
MRVCISGQKEAYVYVLPSACAVFDAGIKTQGRQLSCGRDRRKEQATGAACVPGVCHATRSSLAMPAIYRMLLSPVGFLVNKIRNSNV